jgi:hypothetical protein
VAAFDASVVYPISYQVKYSCDFFVSAAIGHALNISSLEEGNLYYQSSLLEM